MWTAVEKDLNDSNIPKKFRVMDNSFGSSSDSFHAVSQFQLAMTQFAFVAYPVYCPDRLKIYDASDKDLIAFNHLWAVLGYALVSLFLVKNLFEKIPKNYLFINRSDTLTMKAYYITACKS